MACGIDGGYPYGRHGPNEAKVDGSPYPFGECTDLCWRYYRDQGVQVAPTMGDATNWTTQADVQAYTVYDRPVASNLIACWDQSAYPPFGHVAVVTAVRGGDFQVHEMNFCYSVDADPGRVDVRQVTPSDPQPKGFILPTGAGLGAGAETTDAVLLNALLPASGMRPGAAIPGLDQVGHAIEQAGLEAEAALITMRERVLAGAQIGLGTGLALAGGGVILLSALGRSPTVVARSGARYISRSARRQGRRAVPAIRSQFPESTPQVPDLPATRPVRVPAARLTRTLTRRI